LLKTFLFIVCIIFVLLEDIKSPQCIVLIIFFNINKTFVLFYKNTLSAIRSLIITG